MTALVTRATAAEERLKPRIIQADKRRFSLKLEPVFWEALEDIAAARGIRLNRLVALVAAEPGGQDNLASHLRKFCLAEAQREAAEARLGGGRVDLGGLMDSSPIPCLLIAPNGMVRRENLAFTARFGGFGIRFVGKPFLRHFRFQSAVPVAEAWQRFAAGETFTLRGRVVHVAPGRVTTAEARLFPVPARRPVGFYCILWLALGLPASTGRAVAAR